MRVLVRAPSVDVSSDLYLEVHAQDTSGCTSIWLFYNQDACNQDVYVADVGAQSTRNDNNKVACIEGHVHVPGTGISPPTRVVSFNPHH